MAVEEKDREVEVEEQVGEERRILRVLRDLALPTGPHILHSAPGLVSGMRCSACQGQATPQEGRAGSEKDAGGSLRLRICFCLGGEEGGHETVAVLVMREWRAHMLFAHVVPRKGLGHEHGAQALLNGLQKLGHHVCILKCDWELALERVQEEVKRLREAPTTLQSSGMGDSSATGAAERVVQASGEQVRMLKAGLDTQRGVKVKGTYLVLSWLVSHAASVFP